MKLYSAALSPFTAKVRIALYEKEIPFEKITLAWSPATGVTGKPPEMLAINPKGQVPTMIDGDVKLYDSTVILEYLEERYPKPALYPTAIGDRVLCG
jgi:glutathione S-transferase